METASEAKSVAGASVPPHSDLEELVAALAAVDRRVRLLPARILRRVIRRRHQLPRLRIQLPHETSCIVSRETLLEIVDLVELDQPADSLPQTLILLPQPEADDFPATPPATMLTRYWRLLFHSRVHLWLEERRASGELSSAEVRRRLEQIGMPRFNEIRSILLHEGRLAAGADPWSALVEFAAVYLELKHFASGLLPRFFPAADDDIPIDAVLAEMIDSDGLYAATRPRGAEPPDLAEGDDGSPAVLDPGELPASRGRRMRSLQAYRRLLDRADAAAARGNLVRSCILLQRARQRAPDGAQHRLRNALRGNIHRMVLALQDVLGFSDSEADSWRESISALAARSAAGLWSSETRLLFDLQKICNDRQRNVYALDVWQWLRTFGRRPLKRPLPWLMEVLVFRHLQAAIRRVAAVRIPDNHRRTLHTILHQTAEETEEQLRSRLRPVIGEALRDAEFLPADTVERVAFRKLVEELIDRILDRGFLNLGDLRDAVARNNVKARDLSGPKELVLGDQLLRADRRMAAALDGVYRPGESYMRAIQRLSSLAFGTRSGRLLMRYLVLPFGGAYVVEAGVQHLVAALTGEEPGIEHMTTVLPLGIFLLLLINAETVRRGLVQLSRSVARAARFVFTELPRRVMELEAVQRVLRSRVFRGLVRFGVKPAALTALIYWVMPRLIGNWQNNPVGTVSAFVGANLLLNSRLGRDLEELATDWIGRAWHWVGVQVIARSFWLIMDVFRGALAITERVLYSVDEWLRFRSGESRVALWGKAALGVVWFGIAYVARFCINLLIEPQVNPIKHFPVVTVSHKVLLPLIPALVGVLELAMEKGLAITVATAVITAIPGIFGFLAWELRENWRLYAANRPPLLRPVIVGKHGETVRRLLVWGLHSGTIPKRYAKLRRAQIDTRSDRRRRQVRKHLHALRGMETDVRRFVERELVWLLNEAECYRDRPVRMGSVQLTPNRIRAELRDSDGAGGILNMTLHTGDRWLLAGVNGAEAIEERSPAQVEALAAAVLGLYKAAGIDLAHQEIELQLPSPTCLYEADERGLVVWPEETLDTEVHYDLDNGPAVPRDRDGTALPSWPPLDRSRLLLKENPVAWERWVAVWTALGDGAERDAGRSAQFEVSLRVLPEPAKAGQDTQPYHPLGD
ncbi:MAG: hypothetical protein HUU20_06150 [Pirellulales bacterium]|nr:hypothetical protein [Pirellulales bacterium]